MAILAVYSFAGQMYVGLLDSETVHEIRFPVNAKSGDEITKIERWLGIAGLKTPKFVVTSGYLPSVQNEGIYPLTPEFLAVQEQNPGLHLAHKFSEKWDMPAYVIDPAGPVTYPQASVTGSPALGRNCRCDSFIFNFLVRSEEEKQNLEPNSGRFIAAYLDQEIQIGVIDHGRLLDAVSSRDEGPFAWKQAGGLPFDGLLDLCEESGNKEVVLANVLRESGLRGYLGFEQFSQLFTELTSEQELIIEALAYQIGKEVGGFAPALSGQIDGIILGGELAGHEKLLKYLRANIFFLGKISVYPGSLIINALQAGATQIEQRGG